MNADEFKSRILSLKNRLYRLALRILEHDEDARDIVQDTMLRLWKDRERLDTLDRPEAFAFVVTRNLSLDRLRSKSFRHDPLDNDRHWRPEASPDEMTEWKDSAGLVRRVIAGLPELQRTIIHLRDIEGLEFEEIAEVTEMNVNAIRVNLSRARKKVRDIVIKWQNYELARN